MGSYNLKLRVTDRLSQTDNTECHLNIKAIHGIKIVDIPRDFEDVIMVDRPNQTIVAPTFKPESDQELKIEILDDQDKPCDLIIPDKSSDGRLLMRVKDS